ncbi:hypothetical protein [Psychrosphaera aestuarii]|uniref:hypothetical protein n=1 Tax=Psychrosphaera aestuarii TaxID=1266052 RepID=UPI001B34541C|nr:hypothetical protein [Psychrosphaera aestuarii]
MKKYGEIFYQLTRPISYLFLNHDSGKVYNWKIPSICTFFTLLGLYCLVGLENVAGKDGLLAELSGFIVGLPGFLIAAIAAIATFNRPVIDQEMINAPTINVKVGESKIEDMKLTRRDFLLRLFSYLTVLSIFLVIYQKLGLLTSVPTLLTSTFYIAEWFYVSVFFLFFWQLLTLILFGLYYLCERLNLNL